jgi:2-iminobutanoate/2-iminopropanoate deaminase
MGTDSPYARIEPLSPLEGSRRIVRCMSRHIISTDAAPSSPLFSQGVRAGSTIYVSGMVGVDPATGELPESIEDQTRQALANCGAVLAADGCTLEDAALVTVLLANPDDFAGMNAAYGEVFAERPPARAVARLGPVLPGIRVSIMLTAHADG